MGQRNGKLIAQFTLLLLLAAMLATHGGILAAEDRQAPTRTDRPVAPLDQVAQWKAPDVDVEQLLLEDESNRFRTDIPYRVGFPMKTDITAANSGTWEELGNGDRLWRLQVHTEGALWTVLGFGTFRLQPGGELTVYDLERKAVMGPYTAADIRKHGELWFPPIAGDTLVVELFWPAPLRDQQPRFHLTTVSHGYKPFGVIGRDRDGDNSTRGFGDSGACNIDTACPEAADWQDQKRSVVIVLVGGSGNCSGSLINTTADDCRTYLLTASHCGENGPSTTIGFNFERPECGAGTPPPETNQTLTGGTLLGDYSSSDFTLIEMDEAPPEEFGVYFSGWSRETTPAQFTYVMSHPRGDAKKIAHDADPPVDGTNYGPNHWRIDDSNPDPAHTAYEWGTTEPASSGAPLFDHNHRIIGQLHGGTASCTSDTWDEYGKIDASWTGGGTPSTRLSDWLDPLGTGELVMDGVDHSICLYQPAGIVEFTRDVYSCSDTLTITLRDDNIPGTPTAVDVAVESTTETTPETVTLTQIDPGVGRYSGTVPTGAVPPVNGDGVLSVSHADVLTVTYVDADDGAGGSNVTVTDNADTDCAPPVISSVQSSAVTGSAASITWDTDEPADSTVNYGLSPPGGSSDYDAALVTAHDVRLRNLAECSTYYYWVASTDSVGNAASDDNLGTFYTFETGKKTEPEFLSTDTPIPIDDNATHTSTISVADDKTVLEITVKMNITHTYTGDIEATLISPDGTRVLLVADRGGSGENFADTVFDDDAATPISSGAAPFTGSFQPEEPLSGAAGISSLGDWILEVVDDAGGDTGTLESWTLTLTYPAQSCGPSATYDYHSLEADVCATGAGHLNGYWDTGEQIQFSLTVENDGTDPLTAVTAQVTPLTAGVTVIDDTADYGGIAEGASATSLSPHYTAELPLGLTCGQDLSFEVAISANEGGWIKSFTQIAGEVIPGGTAVAYSENFDAAGIPVDWTIVDGFSDGFTWYSDDATDPAGCANTDPNPPIAGTWATVDSDCTGSGVAMDEELISPVIDLTGISTVTLEFDHYFNWLGPEKADVDVRSSLTAGAWINVAQWLADTNNPEHAVIDITAHAANVNDLQIRWHYYDAEFEWFWHVDNVAITYPTAAECMMPECIAGPAGPPPIPHGAVGTQPMLAERLAADGSQMLVTWDEQCLPVNANLIYGPLVQVSTYTTSGSLCAISSSEIWNPAPAGDLWFLLVSDDGAGVESSWGQGAGGERNGLTPSGYCGTTSKNITGSCP
jgi:uncharacterized repeat protein (TIGR01451 family)